jgi:hypothetical protein
LAAAPYGASAYGLATVRSLARFLSKLVRALRKTARSRLFRDQSSTPAFVLTLIAR